MDFETLTVNGVSLIALVFGLVEFFKAAFNLQGTKVTVLSAVIGLVVMLTYQLQALLPESYAQIYTLVISAVYGGLAASGFYKFSRKFTPGGVIELSASIEEREQG